jgi:hypothetical protein
VLPNANLGDRFGNSADLARDVLLKISVICEGFSCLM